MTPREPHVAGAFYPGSAGKCRDLIEQCMEGLGAGEASGARVVAGIVPHAGWIFSGPTAARTFDAVRRGGGVDTFLLLGAVHVWGVEAPSLYASGAWRTPLGDASIDDELAEALLARLAGELVEAPEAHQMEHSLEVQVPFVQHLFPEARIVPLMIPPEATAGKLGRKLARAVREVGGGKRIVALGSTDLTHYGPNYRFMPEGLGARALEWTKSKNDRRILELALEMKEDAIVAEAVGHMNACGPGAMAAACGFAHELGACAGRLLGHTTSFDVMPERQPSSFVGYASIAYDLAG